MMKKVIALGFLLALGTNATAQVEKQQIPIPSAGSGVTVTLGAMNPVFDPSFEGGTPNANWNEASVSFGTPLCDAACGDGGGTAGARTGAWWTWLGGTAATTEVASVDQDVTFPTAAAATLDFYIWNGTANAAGPDVLQVNLDATGVVTLAEDDACCTAGYALVSADVSSFADGGTHNLAFSFSETDGVTTNINLDDVAIVIAGTPPPPPVSVPTLGLVGFGALLLALGVFGAISLRRREQA